MRNGRIFGLLTLASTLLVGCGDGNPPASTTSPPAGGKMDTGKMEGGMGKMEGGKMDTGKMDSGKMEGGKMESGKMDEGKMAPPKS